LPVISPCNLVAVSGERIDSLAELDPQRVDYSPHMQKERNKKKCSDKYKTQTAENKLLSEIEKHDSPSGGES